MLRRDSYAPSHAGATSLYGSSLYHNLLTITARSKLGTSASADSSSGLGCPMPAVQCSLVDMSCEKVFDEGGGFCDGHISASADTSSDPMPVVQCSLADTSCEKVIDVDGEWYAPAHWVSNSYVDGTPATGGENL